MADADAWPEPTDTAKRIERRRWHRGLAIPVQADRTHGPDTLDQADQVPSRG